MAIEEAMEEKIQGAALQIIEGGARLTVRVAKSLALALLNSGWQLAKGGAGKAVEAIEKQRNTGNVGEKRLQQMGEDVHEIRLDDQETLKKVTQSLRQAGLTYGVEKTPEGGYYLHFQGKDADHLMHAVERAFKQLGLEFDPSEVLKVPAEPTQERSGEETRQTEEATQAEPERAAGAAGSETAEPTEPEPETTGRVEWGNVRPDILDYAAAEFAASHEQLAGLDPQAARDAIEVDPELRSDFDRSLHDDYGQPYEPAARTRQEEQPAKETPAAETRNEPEPQAERTPENAQGRPAAEAATTPEPSGHATPEPAMDAGTKTPGPRNRKEFFERFKAKYKAKTDAQARKAPARKIEHNRNR